MPSFREVGVNLKEKFDGATEVKLTTMGNARKLMPYSSEVGTHKCFKSIGLM